MNNKAYSLFIFSYALILSAFSLILTNIHPVSWPATASLPGVINMLDSSKFSEDFFALSSQNSPTLIFQKLIFYISYVTEYDAITIMIFLGSIVSFLYLPLFFLITIKGLESSILNLKLNVESQYFMLMVSLTITFFIFILIIIFQNFVNNYFTNMMWPPIFFNPNAYIISMLMGVFGALLLIKNKYICFLLIGISCLLHPAMGFFTAIFSFLILTNFSLKYSILKNIAIFFLPILIIYIVLVIYYQQPGINTQDFFEIYIHQRHPHHYLISKSLSVKLWLGILILLFFEVVFLFLFKNKIWINCLISFALSLLIPPLHYLFTEIYQIKIIAIIGFTRFFTFYFYLVIFFGLACLLSCINKYFIAKKYKLNILNHMIFRVQNIYLLSTIILFSASISFYNYFQRESAYMDKFISEFNLKYHDILLNIPNSAVLLALDIDNFHFGLFGNKNLYSTDAFPFSESKFYEYEERRKIYQNCDKFLSFNSLSEAKSKYKLNYVLMKKDRISQLPGIIIIAEVDDFILINIDESFNLP